MVSLSLGQYFLANQGKQRDWSRKNKTSRSALGYLAHLCLMKQTNKKESGNRDSGTDKGRAGKGGRKGQRQKTQREERGEENFAAWFPNSFLIYCIVSILDSILNSSLLTANSVPNKKIHGLILMWLFVEISQCWCS